MRAELTVNVVAEGHVDVPTTKVEVVEGIAADGEPFVEVVEETPEQVEADTAVDEAAEEPTEAAE